MIPKILALGGGKGGTGKSLLCVQLGILFASKGFRVVLIDADHSGANLHTFFGLEEPEVSIEDVLYKTRTINQAILPSGTPGLGILPGVKTDLLPFFTHEQFAHCLTFLPTVDAHLVILDLGTGLLPWNIQLFEAADLSIQVIVPEAICLEREYRFIRSVCRCRISGMSAAEDFPESGWLPVPWLSAIRKENQERAIALETKLRKNPIGILVNHVLYPEDRTLSQDITRIYRRFFGLHAVDLSYLSYDDRLSLSSRERRPMILEYPHSSWTEKANALSTQILKSLQLELRS